MIDIKTLTADKVGEWVTYRDSGGKVEHGKIKSWNKHSIFVVYNPEKLDGDFRKYTAASTRPEDLEWYGHDWRPM